MTISANFPNVQPSLLLDFANAKQLPPSVTFTRATTATYYDGSTTAKAEQNFFFYSQDFSQAAWAVNGATKTSTTQTDPAGGSTALLLTKVTDDGYSLRQYSGGPNPAGKTFTYSVYLKGASAGSLRLFVDNGVDQSFISDISITTSWVRYTLTTGAFNNTTAYLTAGIALLSGSVTSVNVAFAQIEERSSATAYTATTTQPITNYIPVLLTAGGGQPRFDHNPTTSESLGLLIEEQRTNVLQYSANLSVSPWTTSSVSVTAATVIAPDGTLSGNKIIPDATNNVHYIRQLAGSSANYTFSCYFKAAEYASVVMLGVGANHGGAFNLSSGTVTATYGSASAAISSVGNGWYRCSISLTVSGTDFYVYVDNAGAYIGNGFNGVYAWGAQLEAASFPTSYIPTTSAAATRAVDAVTMTGAAFASFNNNQQFTVICKASRWTTEFVGNQESVWSVAQSSPAKVVSGLMLSGLSYRAYYETAADLTVSSAWTANTSSTFAQAYQIDNYAACANGGSVSTDSSGDFGLSVGFDTLYIGRFTSPANQFNGWVQKFAYYPQRIINAQLQALSS